MNKYQEAYHRLCANYYGSGITTIDGYPIKYDEEQETEDWATLQELVFKQEKYRWHDLRKDSSDTPDKLKDRFGDEYYEVVFEDEEFNNPRIFFKYDDCDGFGSYHDYYDEKTLGFVDSEFESASDLIGSKIIAWRLIEPFEEARDE